MLSVQLQALRITCKRKSYCLGFQALAPFDLAGLGAMLGLSGLVGLSKPVALIKLVSEHALGAASSPPDHLQTQTLFSRVSSPIAF